MRTSLPLGSGTYDDRIVAFIDDFWKTQYRAPSIRDVTAACGVSSTSVTAYTLRRLEQTGKYVLSRGKVIPVWVKNAIENAQLVACGRCKKEIQKETAEVCWYCIDWLCCDCWDKYGHCGHKEADEANERARQVEQP